MQRIYTFLDNPSLIRSGTRSPSSRIRRRESGRRSPVQVRADWMEDSMLMFGFPSEENVQSARTPLRYTKL